MWYKQLASSNRQKCKGKNGKSKEGLQNYRNNCQELPITSKLFATVYLLPPSQPIVDTLIFCKRSPLLPVEKVICDLNMILKVKNMKICGIK